jgi:hypothetical protein
MHHYRTCKACQTGLCVFSEAENGEEKETDEFSLMYYRDNGTVGRQGTVSPRKDPRFSLTARRLQEYLQRCSKTEGRRLEIPQRIPAVVSLLRGKLNPFTSRLCWSQPASR